ncbi:MAG: hypothetical protein KGD64_01970 [Candidatus Heimdallarchaeota archaeon]|nr:hypothetical protein [Candidatus Heimdallarchaeota archaeon]
MKKIRTLSLIFLFVSTLFISYGAVSAGSRSIDTEVHSVIINEAYYIGYDIFTTITVTVQTDSKTENYYLKVTLINPLGEEVDVVLHIITSLETLTLEFIFYNYATEAGDYTVEATIVTNDNGWFVVTDVLVFDPPGGGTEGDPYVGIRIT